MPRGKRARTLANSRIERGLQREGGKGSLLVSPSGAFPVSPSVKEGVGAWDCGSSVGVGVVWVGAEMVWRMLLGDGAAGWLAARSAGLALGDWTFTFTRWRSPEWANGRKGDGETLCCSRDEGRENKGCRSGTLQNVRVSYAVEQGSKSVCCAKWFAW